MEQQPITLLELNRRISEVLRQAPGITNQWVTAETPDVRLSGGHRYMELIDKDPNTGNALARIRATIWARDYARISEKLRGNNFALKSDIKVMVLVSVSFHPLYGISATITDINPEYTMGELLRRRAEMIQRLTAAGIINNNRELARPVVPQRIAVISAAGAAGYGDFIDQLLHNPYRLRFNVRLFPAVMQGDKAAPSIINALRTITSVADAYDCVVLIRGGGATGDLAAFDDYDLAATIAMFPLPVIIGIGHERDITLLDYVANMRVKTPTAAAEWLINCGAGALATVQRLGTDILTAARVATANAHRYLDTCAGQLPLLARAVIDRARTAVGPQVEALMTTSTTALLRRHTDRIASLATLLDSLSPEATLRRGFSITRVNDMPLTDAAQITNGDTITTTLADGSITAIVNK